MNKTPSRSSIALDIYCRVVDNFGDAGICWRLSRQLASEYAMRVRLIIDKPEYIDKLANDDLAGVTVLPWDESPGIADLPQVIIAAFQCALPSQLDALLRAGPPQRLPLWINLDYLSAQPWVDDSHGRPSYKAGGGIEWFFLPGFTPDSGGLIRESQLPIQDSLFIVRTGQHAPDRAFEVSLFCYAGHPIAGLVNAWRNERRTIKLWVTAGCDQHEIREQLRLAPGTIHAQQGSLQVEFLPWLAQPAYDQLLRRCDLNFVRGEDSWIRAIWAGKPFIWLPYPQADAAHVEKLDAFIDRLSECFAIEDTTVVRKLAHAWNHRQAATPHWQAWFARYESLARCHAQFSAQMRAQPSLAERLSQFIHEHALL